MGKVRIYVMGKEFEVPLGLTIMKSMEYLGYRFIRGAGCRGGFCGACATVYRMKGDYKIRVALACQKIVEDGMYLTMIPFAPAEKPLYNLDELRPSKSILLEYYPEIARCVSCNTCTKACPQNLEVMDYVQAAIRGDLKEVTELSFDCIQCGLCAIRCPTGIVPYNVGLLARRLYGKYIVSSSKELENRLGEVKEGRFDKELEDLMKASKEKLKELYEKERAKWK